MNWSATRIICALILICGAPQFVCAVPPSTLDTQLTELHTAEAPTRLPETARIARIENAYLKLFSSAQNSQNHSALPDKDVKALFTAAQTAAFYTLKPIYVDYMQADLTELEHRGLATDRQYQYLFQRLVAIRRFSAASDIANKHPGVEFEQIPAVQERVPANWHGPSELSIDEQHHALTHRVIDLGGPAQIVVIAHPLCHFSQNAVAALATDDALGPVLRDHAMWLAPPDGRFELSVFEQWNDAHPNFQMSIAYAKWPAIDDWSTPVFYFFKHGRLVEKVTGWPTGGHREEIRKALQDVGLLK